MKLVYMLLVVILISCGGYVFTAINTKSSTKPIENNQVANQLNKQSAPAASSSKTVTAPQPTKLKSYLDIKYKGAFRALTRGESSSSYAVGVLGVNTERDSIYMAGHSHHNAIAEFAIPDTLSFEKDPKQVVKAKPLQNYARILSSKDKKKKTSHGKLTNRITGILHYQDRLLVSSEIWYDAAGTNKDNLLVLDANDIKKPGKGMLQLEGQALAAGYMFELPENLHDKLDAKYGLGWSSVYSITSRYSQGPSFFTFNPQDALDIDINKSRQIATRALQVYPLKGRRSLIPGADKYQNKKASPIWSALSKARYGFVVPNTDLFIALGSTGGIESGIGYKIKQDNGKVCSGGCTYKASDNYNYFWVFNVNDMLVASNPWDPRPISYGKWELPYKGRIIGASYHLASETLYISISNAARVGKYDRPPMIVTYQVSAPRSG